MRYAAFSCMILLTFVGSSVLAQDEHELIHDDLPRSYLLHVPESLDPGQPAPLLIALHGGGGDARSMVRLAEFNALANEQGFIVVYPNGYDERWNDGRQFRTQPPDTNDVDFVGAIIDDLRDNYQIDPNRVFATGISNGGHMAFRLACELADQIVAVAPVTANMPVDIADDCQPSAPVSLAIFNGTADPLVPYEGGQVRLGLLRRGRVMSSLRSLEFWSERNKCAQFGGVAELPDLDPDDGTRVELSAWLDCDDSVAVQLYTIIGGGHTWPGGPQYLPEDDIGPVSYDIDATQAIWAFFKAVPSRDQHATG